MNFQERYDEVIILIGDHIKKNKKDILDLVFEKFPYETSASVNSAFEFISGMRLKSYITQRKLIRTLEYKKETGCSLEEAIEEFDYSSATNYMRDFKDFFGTTVSEMSDEQYESLISPRYIKEVLSPSDDLAFMERLNDIREWLSLSKGYVINPERYTLLEETISKLQELLDREHYDTQVEIKPCSLGTGDVVVTFDCYSIVMRNMDDFYDAIKHLSNFEIYPVDDILRFSGIFPKVASVVTLKLPNDYPRW